MTGLNVEVETIIEMATIITDSELNVLEEGPSLAIHQDDEILGRMDDWNQKQHAASGLLQRVRESRVTLAEAERQTLNFIKQYCPPNNVPLCGNSVGQDRKFLEKYMKELHDYLHYRNIDVSSVKELVNRWYANGPQAPKKSDAHLALTDIQETIEEMRFYRKHFFVPKNHNPSV